MPDFLRNLAKRLVLTGNTARYLIEMPRLEEALATVGPIGRMLDAGAGGGHYAVQCYLPRCRELVGLDFDDHNFSLLERALRPLTPRAQAVRGSVLDLPFPDEDFDFVASTQVLEHLEADGRAVDEFARVLRPGGYALITVPHPPAPWPEGGHVREGYTTEALDDLFTPRGFRRLRTDWFMTLDSQRICKLVHRFRSRLPRVFRFRELRQNWEERRAEQPYCQLGLFRKEI